MKCLQVMLCFKCKRIQACVSFPLRSYQWQRHEGTVALFVVQNPERKRP